MLEETIGQGARAVNGPANTGRLCAVGVSAGAAGVRPNAYFATNTACSSAKLMWTRENRRRGRKPSGASISARSVPALHDDGGSTREVKPPETQRTDAPEFSDPCPIEAFDAYERRRAALQR